jgi:hypothetical protein
MAIDRWLANIMVPRYLGFVHIPAVLILAGGVHALGSINRPRAANSVVAFLVFTTVVFHLVPFYRDDLKVEREDWAELIAGLCASADDRTLVLTDLAYFALDYYGDCFEGDTVAVKSRVLNAAAVDRLDIDFNR